MNRSSVAWPVLALSLAAACGPSVGGRADNSTTASGPRPASTSAVGGTPAAPAASRTPIPTNDSYSGLAVDGLGAVWFSEDNTSRLGRYQAGRPIQEIPLRAGGHPRTLRSAPDGSVWFAEPGLRRLGRVTPDGRVTEKDVTAGEFSPNWAVAVGDDGSVWYDAGSTTGRLRPDGTTTTYPVRASAPITVDSHGNAWVPMASIAVDRISDAGQVSEFKFDNGIEQLAEAPDGNMWFVDVRGANGPRVGWIDANGQTRFFDAVIADEIGFPNSILRAPDGAVWFGTSDGRLVRLASETDVTVYSLPWQDAALGTFVVLPGNRIVMLGNREVLDFFAVNGTRVGGAQALPTPLPHVAKSPAEGAAYAAAVVEAGTTAKIEFGRSWEGDHAAAFVYSVNAMRAGYVLFVYMVEDGGAWRKYDSFGTQNLAPPSPGLKETLRFLSGCLNVHEAAGQDSKVVGCLPSGTEIEIDGLPVYADSTMWWHLVGRGWAAHAYLYCVEGLYKTRPGC